MRFVASLVLFAGLAFAAGCGKKADPAAAVSIDGTYLIVAMQLGEKKLPDDEIAKMPVEERTIIFNGDKMTSSMLKKDDVNTFKLDTSKSPAQIDITEKRATKDKMTYAIFKLEGDTLTIHGNDDSDKAEDRPKDFTPTANTMTMMLKKK